jgi:hypothetical protein
MKYILAVLAALVLLVVPAQADFVNNLSISALPNPVPQSLSNPCIICGTTAPGQPADFGYNNFSNHGNDTSFNTFSTNILGGGVLVGDLQANALPYSGTLLEAFAGAGLTFGVAIDINTAQGGETLTSFQLIDLSKPAGQRIIFDFSGALALPDIHNGNGKGDYLITGFNLGAAGVQPGDNLIFHASWSGASDGAESFYLVPQLAAVPGPVVGAGIPGLVAVAMGLIALARRRRLIA